MNNASVPQNIRPQRLHKLLIRNIRKQLMRPHDPCIGEKHIQSPILGHRFIDDPLHGRLVRSVELPRMHLDGRV